MATQGDDKGFNHFQYVGIFGALNKQIKVTKEKGLILL